MFPSFFAETAVHDMLKLRNGILMKKKSFCTAEPAELLSRFLTLLWEEVKLQIKNFRKQGIQELFHLNLKDDYQPGANRHSVSAWMRYPAVKPALAHSNISPYPVSGHTCCPSSFSFK